MYHYQDHIMDHYRNPRNRKSIDFPDFSSDLLNPSCGDAISMQGKIEHGHVTDIGFSGSGCVISQAAASMLTQLVIAQPVADLKTLDSTIIKNLIGIELGPTRLKCALLPLEALQAALAK